MNDLRQAAQQALVALEGLFGSPEKWESGGVAVWRLGGSDASRQAITALKAALEQQAETPPEWPLVKNILAEYGLGAISFVAEFKAAQRPWVGLTDEDWEWVADKKETSLDTFAHGAAWAADQLKEKNT